MSLQLGGTWEEALNQIRTWARVNSPWAIHFNSGSCNGCDIEILATLTPRYDHRAFRHQAAGQPAPRRRPDLHRAGHPARRANAWLRTYEQMPDPKFVDRGRVVRYCKRRLPRLLQLSSADIGEVIPVNVPMSPAARPAPKPSSTVWRNCS